jgi:AAA domain
MTQVDYKPDWKRWHQAGFTSELLPIIPPKAPMSEGSNIRDPGKTPGVLNTYGKWSGLMGWPIFKATEEHLRGWKKMGAGIGMNVRNHPAIDIDAEDAELVEMIHGVAQEMLGDAPVRYRGDSPRILLVYRSGFKPKGRQFICRMSEQSPNHMVELLGTQYVVEGIHKRGAPYQWRTDNGYRHPCDIGPAGLTEITEATVDRFFDALAEHVQLRGGTIVEDSKTKKRERSAKAGKRVADEDDWGIELARRYVEEKAPEGVQGAIRNTAFKVSAGIYDYGVSEHTCRELLHEWNETKAGGLASEGDLEEVIATGQTNRDTAVGAKHPGVGFENVEGIEERPSPELQAKIDAYWERQKKIDAMEDAANEKAQVPHLWLPAEPWWREPVAIPKREWLYVGKHYMRGDISATVAPGGLAKTTRGVQEAVDMAANYGLRVLLLNGEEDKDELDRRIAATCAYYKKTRDDLGGRLFAVSCRAKPPRFAVTGERGLAQLNQGALEELEDFVRANKIDVFMLDPLISFHRISENQNEPMDLLLKEGLGGVASRTQAGGEVFHHVGKPKPGAHETVVDDARGASAIIAAVRSARVLNRMTAKEATALGLVMNEEMRRRHIRISNGKANKAPVGKAEWMRIEVQTLPNGDEIAVTRVWTPPAAAALDPAIIASARVLAGTGMYRADKRSPQWFGYPLARMLGLTSIGPGGKPDESESAHLDATIKALFKMHVISSEERHDEQRRMRSYIVAVPEPKPGGESAEKLDADAMFPNNGEAE